LQIEGNLIDVQKGEIYPAKVTFSETITKIEKTTKKYENYIVPGFIEAHIRTEDSFLSPAMYTKQALLSGVTTVVEDFSGYLQVGGIEAAKYVISEFSKTPINFFFLYPVNIERNKLESGPSEVTNEEYSNLIKDKHCLGLTQVDDVTRIREQDSVFLKRVNAARAMEKPIISNISKVHFTDLSNFAQLGIRADIGSNVYQEAFEKACFGIKIKIVEGTKRKTLVNLIRLAKQFDTSIVSEEKSYTEVSKGYLRNTIKKALSLGLDPITTIKNVTINPAKLLGINEGVIEVGKRANIVELDNLKELSIKRVFIDGEMVVKNDELMVFKKEISKVPKSNIELIDLEADDFRLDSSKKHEKVKVISAIDSVLSAEIELAVVDKAIQTKDDILKVVVAGTQGNSQISINFVKDFKMQKGAIATNLYGSSGNIIAIGTNDEDIADSINKLKKMGGGFIAVDKQRDSRIVLPIYGITTNQEPTAIHEDFKKMNLFLKRIGVAHEDPFVILGNLMNINKSGFRFTDCGVIDTAAEEIIEIIK
jgi:adenine deaminase